MPQIQCCNGSKGGLHCRRAQMSVSIWCGPTVVKNQGFGGTSMMDAVNLFYISTNPEVSPIQSTVPFSNISNSWCPRKASLLSDSLTWLVTCQYCTFCFLSCQMKQHDLGVVVTMGKEKLTAEINIAGLLCARDWNYKWEIKWFLWTDQWSKFTVI